MLSEIERDLDRATSLDAWYSKLESTPNQFNAVYECFCAPGLLRSPGITRSLKRICYTQKLQIEGPVAGLISFLFQDDEMLQKLAENSWKIQGPLITVPIFDSTMLGLLEDATRNAQEDPSTKTLKRFFRGLSTIIQNVDKDVVMKCISGAEKDPIKFALHRVGPSIPYWHPLLRLFQVLMLKLKQDVWDVIHPFTPSGFGDIIFHDRLFVSLLRDTEQGTSGESDLLDLTEWMSQYIESIDPLLRPTTAPSLIHQIFRNDLPALSKGMCFKEGMKVLSSTLKAVESKISTGNVLITQANDLFEELKQSVIEVAFSEQIFEDQLMEKHMLLAQSAAQDAIASAISMDVQFLATDYECLGRKKDPTKGMYQRGIRTELWEVVARRFPLNNSAFCTKILKALKGVMEFDQLYNSPKASELTEDIRKFNEFREHMDVPLSNILKSMGRCSEQALESMLSDQPSFEVLLGLMMSRSEDVAMSAEDVAIKGLKAEDRVDVLRLMLVKNFSNPILSLTSISRVQAKLGAFGMMPRWVKICGDVLQLLCDRTEGIIRKSDMAAAQRTLLKVFWDTQWRCLGIIFRRSRRWAMCENKIAMVGFLRDAMDFGENLFDNFWTYEQALRASMDDISGDAKEESWSAKLLADASKTLNPFITILSIQDEHLLQTCQKLICKILGLLADNDVKVEGGDGFFPNLKKYLFPETFPGYDASKTMPTNLTDVQKTELSVVANRLCPDFIPGEANLPVSSFIYANQLRHQPRSLSLLRYLMMNMATLIFPTKKWSRRRRPPQRPCKPSSISSRRQGGVSISRRPPSLLQSQGLQEIH